MTSLMNTLSQGSERVEGTVVYIEDRAVGLIRPSLVEGIDSDNFHYFGGPSGISIVHDPDKKECIIESLIEAGGIIFGDQSEIEQVQSLFINDTTSRTASYFCCIARNCSALINAFRNINSSKVLILGCGGIGSMTALQLAGAGIGSLTMIDDDVVEKSNLNRQYVWTNSDIGRNKVDILVKAINDRFLSTCEGINEKVSTTFFEELDQSYDAIVISADEPLGLAEDLLSRVGEAELPLIVSCGYFQDRAIVKLWDEKSVKKCRAEGKYVNWRRYENFIGPSFGPMNMEIAAIAASAVLHGIAFSSESRLTEENKSKEYSWKPCYYA